MENKKKIHLEKRLKNNESESSKFDQSIQEYEKKSNDIKDQITKEKSQREKDLAELHLVAQERNTLEQQFTKLQLELEQCQTDSRLLEELEADNEYLRRNLTQNLEDIRDFEQKINHSESRTSATSDKGKSEVERLKAINNRLIEKIQEEVKLERERAQTSIDQIKNEYKNKLKSLEVQIEDIKTTTKETESESRVVEIDTESERRKITELRGDIIKSENKISLLEGQINKLKQNTTKLSLERSDAESKLYSVTRELESLQIKLDVSESHKNEVKTSDTQ